MGRASERLTLPTSANAVVSDLRGRIGAGLGHREDSRQRAHAHHAPLTRSQQRWQQADTGGPSATTLMTCGRVWEVRHSRSSACMTRRVPSTLTAIISCAAFQSWHSSGACCITRPHRSTDGHPYGVRGGMGSVTATLLSHTSTHRHHGGIVDERDERLAVRLDGPPQVSQAPVERRLLGPQVQQHGH